MLAPVVNMSCFFVLQPVFYSAPTGEYITITLKPSFSVPGDDAELIFRVKSDKLSTLKSIGLPRKAVEAEICNLFSDDDFDMLLDGRYVEKWKTDLDWVCMTLGRSWIKVLDGLGVVRRAS